MRDEQAVSAEGADRLTGRKNSHAEVTVLVWLKSECLLQSMGSMSSRGNLAGSFVAAGDL